MTPLRRALLLFCVFALTLSVQLPPADAQTRAIGAHALILDDNAGNTITIFTPVGGWSGNLSWYLPVSPSGATASGFAYPGTAAGDLLTWVMPNTTGPAPNNYAGGAQGSWQPATASSLGFLTGTVTVDKGGTGLTSLTPYSLITGGTTSTGAVQQVASVGTSGQVLTSNGNNAIPTWQNAATSLPTGAVIAFSDAGTHTGFRSCDANEWSRYLDNQGKHADGTRAPCRRSPGQRKALCGRRV